MNIGHSPITTDAELEATLERIAYLDEQRQPPQGPA
jgi:hypothetical protein